MTDDSGPWAFIESLKGDSAIPNISEKIDAQVEKHKDSIKADNKKPPPPPSTEIPKSVYLDQELNLNRAADIIMGNGLMSYTARDMMDSSDERTMIAGQVATNIVNDIMDGLKYYMRIEYMDPMTKIMLQLQRMIQVRYHNYPLKPYIKLDMRYRLGKITETKSKKRDRDGVLKVLKIGEGGDIEVDEAGALVKEADRVLDGKEEEEEQETEEIEPVHTAEETIALIEKRHRKVASIKHAARQNVNIWIYNRMYTRKFLTFLGGSIGHDTLNSLCRLDIPETILNVYMDKRGDAFEKEPYHKLEKLGLYSIGQVEEFIGTLSTSGSESENAILDYIKKDKDDTIACFNELVIASLLVTTIKAWNFLQQILIEFNKISPHVKGFAINRPYMDIQTGVPDFRMILKPLPLGTNFHAQVEFCQLVQLYQADIKSISYSKEDTRYQVRHKDQMMADAVKVLLARLDAIGFDGIMQMV